MIYGFPSQRRIETISNGGIAIIVVNGMCQECDVEDLGNCHGMTTASDKVN